MYISFCKNVHLVFPIIDGWMKKTATCTLSPADHEILVSFLLRVYPEIKNEREKKEWQDLEKGIWKDVKKWLNEEDTSRIFKQIIN